MLSTESGGQCSSGVDNIIRQKSFRNVPGNGTDYKEQIKHRKALPILLGC